MPTPSAAPPSISYGERPDRAEAHGLAHPSGALAPGPLVQDDDPAVLVVLVEDGRVGEHTLPVPGAAVAVRYDAYRLRHRRYHATGSS
ncbi:hypothetical protein HNR23_000057 [Nocardiopsis mwathae]|uniref:Uncharacterized protein n=1 Tax=Nocardiopsis mwathae TaxID=1472723 RepID=A0A7X0D3B8_9ACTN|nr:hypothetical protein [Nocardiopsis mwathae]